MSTESGPGAEAEHAAEIAIDDHNEDGQLASDVDVEHVGGPAFWIGHVVGWAVIIGGIRAGLHDREVKPIALLKWLAAGLIVHDAIWLPLLAIVASAVTFAIRRRLPAFIVWAAMTSIVLFLIAWPFLRGYGRRSDVPSALQRNYARGLLAYVVVTWAIALAASVVVRRRRRAASSR